MRLLSTIDLTFREFYDSQIPQYAILSHRWIGDEVSFEEFYDIKARDSFGKKYAKIRNCCARARKVLLEWVWIDTCCIDKKSSAELSEAINSMFNWYKNAAVCYVYLADVEWNVGDLEQSRDNFRKSAWFERGWTLQELLAPRVTFFADSNWKLIDMIKKPLVPFDAPSPDYLIEDVSERTKISKRDFSDVYDSRRLEKIPVARKFSWLSNRQTSRVEDMAYCMLGLCGVNMPLLYGEGEKAFRRLQQEIIKNSDDESIFAWFSGGILRQPGVLASSPKAFARSGQIVKNHPLVGKMPFAITNKGLHYQLPVRKGSSVWDILKFQGVYELPLDCGLQAEDDSTDESRAIAIRLTSRDGLLARVNCQEIIQLDRSAWTSIMNNRPEYENVYLEYK